MKTRLLSMPPIGHLNPCNAHPHWNCKGVSRAAGTPRIPISREGVGVGVVVCQETYKLPCKKWPYSVGHHLWGLGGGDLMFALFHGQGKRWKPSCVSTGDTIAFQKTGHVDWNTSTSLYVVIVL